MLHLGYKFNFGSGLKMQTVFDYKNHPANKGIDYEFNGSISEEVLVNYLSRSVIYQDAVLLAGEKESILRFILSTGAKYIGRAGCYWNPAIEDELTLPLVKEFIDRAHSFDPDIIFEACFFENISASVNDIAIPAWVFEAFGMEAEERNFNFQNILYAKDSAHAAWRTMWGANAGVPDINNLETQMLLYYRARCYIDAGYEGLHFGQVHLIGAEDENWKNFTKVLDMIRDYAKKNARRGMILMNSHTHGIIDANGKLMCDFHAYPLRGKVPEGSVDHYPTADNPQDIIFEPGYNGALFCDSLGGETYSGWSCEHLPYFVEVDNFLGPDHINKYRNKASSPFWGYDDISWFANQPAAFRRKWIEYAYNRVKELDWNGTFEMCGRRQCFIWDGDTLTKNQMYKADHNVYVSGGFGDENAIRSVWIKDRNKRLK